MDNKGIKSYGAKRQQNVSKPNVVSTDAVEHKEPVTDKPKDDKQTPKPIEIKPSVAEDTEKNSTETWKRIQPRLTAVKLMAQDGATNAMMAQYLGVSLYTFNTYRNRYPEFKEAVTLGRKVVETELVSKLYELAMGQFNIDRKKEITTEITQEVEDKETGELVEKSTTKSKIISVKENGQVAPDLNAIRYYLSNIAPERWQRTTSDGGDIKPIVINDDIPKDVDSTSTPKVFYDDSQDVGDDDK